MTTETSFCEIKGKEIINIINGKCLGKIIDIVFDVHCFKILGFVVPSQNRSWNIFKSSEDIFIPIQDICKIGEDVILVRVFLPNINIQKAKTSKYKNAENVGKVQNQPETNFQSENMSDIEQNYIDTYKIDANKENTT